MRASTPEYFHKLLEVKNHSRSPNRQQLSQNHNTTVASVRSTKNQHSKQNKPTGNHHKRIEQTDVTSPPHASNVPRGTVKTERIVSHEQKPISDDDSKAWIHCNHCFEPYMHKRNPFFLLSCEHVMCGPCIKQPINNGGHYVCNVCNKKVRRLQINNNMPSHLKELFHLTPYDEGLNLNRIYNFQVKHRDHLAKNMEVTRGRLIRAHQQNQQQIKQKSVIDEEYNRLCNTSTKFLRDIRKIANQRKYEKALQEQENNKKIPDLYDDSALSITDPLEGGAQKHVQIVPSRRGRQSLQTDINRNVFQQKFPMNIQKINNSPENVTFFKTYKSPFNL